MLASIRQKLFALIGLAMVLLVALALFSKFQIDAMNSVMDETITELGTVTAAVNTVRKAQVHFKMQVQEWKDVLLRGNDQQAFDRHFGSFAKDELAVRQDLSEAKVLLAKLGTAAAGAIDAHSAKMAELGARYRQALKSFDPAQPQSGMAVDRLVQGIDREPTAAIDQLVTETEKLAEEIRASNNARAGEIRNSTRNSLLAAVVAAICVLVVFAQLLMRAVLHSLNNAVAAVERIAAGDLTHDIEARTTDGIGRVFAALKHMQQNLRDTVGTIQAAADHVGGASSEIAQGNHDLSGRTEEQASALEETAASMEEMTITVSQNADNARIANQLVTAAAAVAARGGQAVREVVGTMNGITESSRKISDIIGVIDGIAFQTNILALNAAVEAARAGEQGRGFAVVASEVRGLARRSAAAAKEIKGLIGDSVTKVDAGSRQVEAAGATVEEIVVSVGRVSALISEIATASREQAQGIEQVSATVTQLEKVTQQNAAMVEEASAASASLEEQATQLVRSVSKFKLDQRAQVADSAVAAAPIRRAPAVPGRNPIATQRTLSRPQADQHLADLSLAKNREAGREGNEAGWKVF